MILDETWFVKRTHTGKTNMVLLPDIKKLPRDPEWEAVEERIAAHSVKNLPPFEE